MGDDNGVSRQVHGAAVSHHDGLFGEKVGARPHGTGRGLADLVELVAARQLGMSRRVAHYVEDRLADALTVASVLYEKTIIGCLFLLTRFPSKEPTIVPNVMVRRADTLSN